MSFSLCSNGWGPRRGKIVSGRRTHGSGRESNHQASDSTQEEVWASLHFAHTGTGTTIPCHTIPSPLEPLSPSLWTPLSLPLALNHVRIRVLGTFFVWPNFFSCAFGTPIVGFFHHSTRITSSLCCVADIMSQRPMSMLFSTLIQPCPHVKHDDSITPILYFHFQERWSRKKKQEAYNVTQKACSTLFLNTPMATPFEIVRQVNHPAQILLVPLPVRKRKPKVSPPQVSPFIFDKEFDDNEHFFAFLVCVALWCSRRAQHMDPKR